MKWKKLKLLTKGLYLMNLMNQLSIILNKPQEALENKITILKIKLL